MTPAYRASLIARAKRAAEPVARSVAGGLPVDWLIGDMDREQLLALVLVLADAADPARLRAVVRAEDDDAPGVTDADLKLRAAHAEAVRLRKAKRPVPFQVRVLDTAYCQARKQARAWRQSETEVA